MRRRVWCQFGCVLAVAGTVLGTARAAEPAEPEAPLTASGEQLLNRYSTVQAALQAELAESLPRIDESQKAAFLQAYRDESVARVADLKALRAQGGKKVKDKDAAATTHAAARNALALAATNALAPVQAILSSLEPFLSSDALDATLVKCAVLAGATPRGLAAFAQQGKEQEALVERLLADDALMKQMLIAGGAEGGQYGRAMQIYTDIQKASAQARDGVLQRLALGVSLEHAVPVGQVNAQTETNAPAQVDPVRRYLHYEKAYLDGELDSGFKDLTAWDYRLVVDGDAPDAILAWGREMLRNYRPDHIRTPDYRWRYVKAVKTDVMYGSAEQKFDLPEQQLQQNIIKTGGVCGRRAFFGRFILRCFGIPTVARPQAGHAALGHWTPDGWVINLGAGWEWGWTKKHGEGLDFLAMTQARKQEQDYLVALRAQWIGEVLGEPRTFGFYDAPSGFWNGVALYRQRAIVEASQAVALAAVGQDIAEANESKEADAAAPVAVSVADKRIAVAGNGTITIPAVACVSPTGGTEKIVFVEGFGGGAQLHYNRLGKAETFAYAFEAPAAGRYALTACVVTVSPDQHLMVTPNDGGTARDVAVPYTVGQWGMTPPVEVALVKGLNTLSCTLTEPNRGVTIKELTLTPVP